MNSDIPNILKLSPMAVVKTDMQIESRLSSGRKDETDVRLAVSSNDLQISKANSKEEAANESKKSESASSRDLIKKAVDEGNSMLQAVNRNLQFKVDEDTKELVVKVVDSKSGELVRQIPSEEMLALIKRMQQLDGQQGLMIQDRA
jgi:flagellar protein FlaG